jgi:hypothetical protein
LENTASPDNQFHLLKPVCPLQFRDEVDSSVKAIDQYGSQLGRDSSVGNGDNELYHGVTGVIWSDEHVTM